MSDWIKSQPPLIQGSLRIALQEYASTSMERQTDSILRIAIELINEINPSMSPDEIAESVAPQLISKIGPEISMPLAKIYVLIAAFTIALEG